MADEKDIDELYKRTNNHEARLVQIETAQPYLKEILERSIVTNEKLATTMQEVQITMTSLDNRVEEQAKAMADMNEEFTKAHKETNEKITQVNDKVERIEEKGKFDIWDFIKKNWPWILTLLGIGIYELSRWIKFD